MLGILQSDQITLTLSQYTTHYTIHTNCFQPAISNSNHSPSWTCRVSQRAYDGGLEEVAPVVEEDARQQAVERRLDVRTRLLRREVFNFFVDLCTSYPSYRHCQANQESGFSIIHVIISTKPSVGLRMSISGAFSSRKHCFHDFSSSVEIMRSLLISLRRQGNGIWNRKCVIFPRIK